MGITTTYACDKCDHTQERPTQMWYIGISRRAVDSPFRTYGGDSTSEQQMWCRACVEELGILPRSKSDEAKNPVPSKPTLAEMIKDILTRINEEVE